MRRVNVFAIVLFVSSCCLLTLHVSGIKYIREENNDTPLVGIPSMNAPNTIVANPPALLVYTLSFQGTKYFDHDRVFRNRFAYAKLQSDTGVFMQTKIEPNLTMPAWQKIFDLKRALEENKFREWIWFLDADAMIMSGTISALSLARQVADKQKSANLETDIIIAKDCNGINSGSFLVRNSNYSISLANKWLSYLNDETIENQAVWWEQASLIFMMKNNILNVNDHIAIVPQSKLNSYISDIGCGDEYKPGDLVVHSPGFGYQALENYLNKTRYEPV